MPLFQIWSQVTTEEEQAKQHEALMDEIISIYKVGNENDLRIWARTNKTRITSDFISSFANGAFQENYEGGFQIAKIIAIESENKKGLAYVLFYHGRYYSKISDYNNAIKLLQEAEIYFKQVADSVGLSDVYYDLGNVYFHLFDINKATLFFTKSLSIAEQTQYPLAQGNAYCGLGRIHFFLGKNKEALRMYNKALPLFEKTKDPLGQGNVFNELGEIYTRLGDNSTALTMYVKALPFFEKAQDHFGQGNIHEALGRYYQIKGDNNKAIMMYEKALAFFLNARDPIGQGNVFLAKGELHARSGENEKAIEMFEKAFVSYEKAQNLLGQGNALDEIGDAFSRIGEVNTALEMFVKALDFFKKVNSPISQCNTYMSIGDIYFFKGEYSSALAFYEKALPLFERVQNPLGQGLVNLNKGQICLYTGENAKVLMFLKRALLFYEKSGEFIGQGNVYRTMGDFFVQLDENAKALAMYDKALVFYEKAKEPIGQGNIYIRKGNIYRNSGNPSKAQKMYEKVFPFIEKAQNLNGIATMQLTYGQLFFDINNNDVALEMYNKALISFEKLQQPLGQGNTYLLKGNVYSRMGKKQKAIEMYEKALLLFDKIQEPLGQGGVYERLGNLYYGETEISKALAMYEKAILLFTKVRSLQGLARLYIKKAFILGRQNKKNEAVDLCETALTYLERIRTQATFPELKKSYFQKNFVHFDDTALFILDNGYSEKGFRVVESMKARLFLDQLAENLAEVDKGLDPELKERQDTLIGKLSVLAKEIEQTAKMDAGVRLTVLKTERDKVQTEFENLQIEIRLKNPVYASVRYPEPVNLNELQQEVLRTGEILIEYYLSIEKAFAFVVTNKDFKVVELPVGSKGIRSTVRGYLEWISKPNSMPAKSEKGIAAGAVLYDQLIKPLESYFSEGATIIFVPDGALAKLPFESLVVAIEPVSKEPVYLLEKNPVKYIQSASVLTFLRVQFKQEGITDAFVGFGDPVYDYENFKKGKLEKGSTQTFKGDDLAELNRARFAREGGILNRLEGSGQEITEIAKIINIKGKANQRLRMDASEEFAKSSAMNDYGYIQFSCHGLLGTDYQSLVLSQIPEAKDDGFLTPSEIMNCTFNARLVVLSACQTGRGMEERGEGITGLTRAVMYAGSPAAVVSLWSVSDKATKDLMVSFYRKMIIDGLPKSEALRAAKLEILKSKTTFRISDKAEMSISHPFFWAAFVMYGE